MWPVIGGSRSETPAATRRFAGGVIKFLNAKFLANKAANFSAVVAITAERNR
jgi:hypothetical protein